MVCLLKPPRHELPPPAPCSCPAQAVGDGKAAAGKEPLATSVAEFYMTDAISRASKVIA